MEKSLTLFSFSELSGFVCPSLLALFRRVVDQLTGLGPPTASAVLLAVMRSCLAALQGYIFSNSCVRWKHFNIQKFNDKGG